VPEVRGQVGSLSPHTADVVKREQAHREFR
jgi:hypothetical protein